MDNSTKEINNNLNKIKKINDKCIKGDNIEQKSKSTNIKENLLKKEKIIKKEKNEKKI